MKTHLHRFLLALVLVCCVHGAAFANACAAVAAGGNWSASATWTACGSTIPGTADSVVLSALTGTLTVDGTSGSPSIVGSGGMDATGSTGTISIGAAKELDVYGNFKLASTITYTPNGTSLVKFVNTSGTAQLTTGTKLLGPVTVAGVGGTVQLQDTTACNTGANNITVTFGSFDTNSQTVNTCGLSSANSNTRSITLGTTTWTLGTTTTGATWDTSTTTGLTFSGASATIAIANTTGGNSIIKGGGLTFGTITSTILTTTSDSIGNLSAGTLTLTSGAGVTSNHQINGNITVSGTCTFNSNSILNRDYITSDVKGTVRTISCATVSSTGADFQDIAAAGAGNWNLSGSTNGAGDCGGNSGITFNTPKNDFAKTAVSANISSATLFFTTSGGSTQITPAYPMPQDTLKFDANSVTSGSVTITVDASAVRLPAMDWTGVTNTPTLAFTTAASYFGSLKFVSGMTVSGTGIMTLEGRGSQTITTAGKTLTASLVTNAPGGTWTQQDNLTDSRASGSALNIIAGTFAAGSFNTTCSGTSSGISLNGGTFTSSGTLNPQSSAAALTMNSGTLDASSGTINLSNATSTATLSGGTLKAGTLTMAGAALTIAGTAVQIGTGGATFGSGSLTISSGSLAPTTGNKITSVSSTAIAVSAASSGGGSCTFGDAGSWLDKLPANDNYGFQYRRAM